MASTLMAGGAGAQTISSFTPGDLVISVYGNGAGTSPIPGSVSSGGSWTAPYADNQASPITLQEVTTSGSIVGQLVLPQTTTTVGGVTNHAISGEYGSSSEGSLQLSANGQFLTIAGYGVSATSYNANPQSYGGTTKSCIDQGNCYPLAQTPSTSVPRVVALVGADGSVDTSTALTNVASGNNPRSVATVDGSTFYISGQGASKNVNDPTQGIFVAQRGASTATVIDNSYETRTVEIYNNQLFVSADTTEGSGVHENVSSYGVPGTLPTSAATASILSGIKSKFAVSSLSQLNAIDGSLSSNSAFTTASKTKGDVYLSPENFFFADPTTLYIADSGNPKGDNNGSGNAAQGLSDGGLQKWTYNSATQTWVLDYTLSLGLNIVSDTTACGTDQIGCGTTGLLGLTGEVLGNGEVELFATNATVGDLDPTYLYGITDLLSATAASTASSESFTVLDTAAPDTVIRGVAFAPQTVPEPATLALLTGSLPLLLVLRRKRRC